MNILSSKQKIFLKGLAHNLKPIVLMGNNGLTEGVIAEINLALDYHELIKVKITYENKDSKELVIDAIIRETDSIKIQFIGNILVLYKANKENKIKLPK